MVSLDRAFAWRSLACATTIQLIVVGLYALFGANLRVHSDGPQLALLYDLVVCAPGLVTIGLLPHSSPDWAVYLVLVVSDIVAWSALA